MICLSLYYQLTEAMIPSLGLSPWLVSHLHSQLLPHPDGKGGKSTPSLSNID